VSTPLVFDTNILISGYLWGGKPRQAIKKARESGFTLLYSRETLDELIRVLSLKFDLTSPEIYRIVMDIRGMGTHVGISSKENPIIEDQADNVFINLAIDGNASVIVRGDSHLLKLTIFKEIEIVRVAEFLRRY
jgi:uncharacterized protein